MKRTPILLLAYNRPREFALTIKSISSCDHSNEYDLYVNIDAPNVFKQTDAAQQVAIKETIQEYKQKFNSIHIKEHIHHKGLANSVIDSVSEIVSITGQVIVIEDDLILSHDCLDYLEGALDYYKTFSNIWAVTAYSAPLRTLVNYKKDTYLSYRPSSWVWGTWANRWNWIDWGLLDYIKNGMDYESQLKFTRGGYDLPEGMRKQIHGLTDSWAIRWGYAAAKENMLTVYPSENRVKYIGFNGTHVTAEFPQMKLKDRYEKCVYSSGYEKGIDSEYRNYNGVTYNQWRRDVSSGKYKTPNKYEALLNVMLIWKELSLDGHNVSEYFIGRNYNIIAIYGKGKIGLFLESELKRTSIKVSYFIDKRNINEGTICYNPDEELMPCDCVVITAMTDAVLIREQLEKKGIKTIRTIVEVLRDV